MITLIILALLALALVAFTACFGDLIVIGLIVYGLVKLFKHLRKRP